MRLIFLGALSFERLFVLHRVTPRESRERPWVKGGWSFDDQTGLPEGEISFCIKFREGRGIELLS